jgi:uncharacterized protein (DUF433 family)
MHLEEYFDILDPNDIRIKGHRVGIESILYEYLHNNLSAEDIDARFPTISLEQIYATILYYLHNKEQVHAYMTRWIEHQEQQWAEQQRNPTPTMLRLRHIKAEWQEVERHAATQPGYDPEQRMERLRRIADKYPLEAFSSPI